MMFSLTILCFSLLSFVRAVFIPREVFDPAITSPTAGTVWNVGDTVLVTWDTSILPASTALVGPGMLVLGFNASNSENLDLDHPLAQQINLYDGNVSITVPNVAPQNNYIVVLFGDSGNASPEFTIKNSGVVASPSSTSPSSSTTPTTTLISNTGTAVTTVVPTDSKTSSASSTVTSPSTPSATSPSGSKSGSASTTDSASSSGSPSSPKPSTSSAWRTHDASSWRLLCLVGVASYVFYAVL